MDACHAILRSNIIYAAGLLTTQFTIGKYFQLTKNAISAKMTNWPVRAAVEFSEMRIRQVENEMRMRPTFHLNIDTADTDTSSVFSSLATIIQCNSYFYLLQCFMFFLFYFRCFEARISMMIALNC